MININFPKTILQGEKACSIGNPLAHGMILNNFVSCGVVSKIINDAILTDAIIIPGNSGGMLINKKGELIGVPSNYLTITIKKSFSKSGIGLAVDAFVIKKQVKSFLPKE
jgi:S1-C subfamily serine protease